MKKAIVLLSGGLDSTTTLAVAVEQGFLPLALSFDYGQRHRFELDVAAKVARRYAVLEHVVFRLDLGRFGGSALTSDMQVPKDRHTEEMEHTIPNTYVPARNTIFLSVALAWAEVAGAKDIFLGVNALDYSGYPDCRPEYIEAFQRMADLATKAGIEEGAKLKIHTPLLHSTKAQIIQRGLALGVDYANTSTCYDPGNGGAPCGRCDACQLRIKGFEELGLSDPLLYSPVSN